MITEATRTRNTEHDGTIPCQFSVGRVPSVFRVSKGFTPTPMYIGVSSRSERGFTLIETLGALAIIGLIAAIGVASFVGFNTREAVEQEVGKLLSVISEARTLTISAKDGSVYGIHFEEEKVVLFTGASYDSGATTNRVQLLNNAVKLSSISLTGGGSDVMFKKLTGGTDQDGTITVSSVRDGVDTGVVTITATGAVYSN